MPQATSTTITTAPTTRASRRSMLGSAAIAFTAAASAVGITAGFAASVADFVPAKSDADLIAACNEYLRIQRAWASHCGSNDPRDDDPKWSMLDPIPVLEEKIIASTATTTEGHMARARCTAFWYMPHHRIAQDDPDEGPDDRFRAALYRDLIEQAGRA